MFSIFKREQKQESDDRLIARFKSTGDLKYLGKLFDRYMHLVFGVCMKYLKNREASQDATMQIFEKLVIELQKRDVENFKPWIHVITKNHCLMELRSQKIKDSQQEKMLNDQTIFMENEYIFHHDKEDDLEHDLASLRKCIDELKAEQKNCVRLFYLEEKCYQQISDELCVELKRVKSFIQNGKRNLKICMERNG